ncbi:MAG: fibronectin type III domain-containing protein, partial [Deltaproteobacteria bacterium]|nr:fibronectin type III domain-containing protein [Deltaproteobacteria bacterium]
MTRIKFLSQQIIVQFLILLFSSLPLLAGNLDLAWDPSTSTEVSGYRLYYGTTSKNYTESVDVGNVTTYLLTGLTDGETYYLAVTAYSSNTESDFSNEVSQMVKPLDLENPAVSFSNPTSGESYATASSTLSLSGTATDDIGINLVTWVQDSGASGTATGTTTWTIAGLSLAPGDNIITVSAYDEAGKKGEKSLLITYTPPDVTAPLVAISHPTSAASYITGTRFINLSGSASDAVGVTRVSWSNNRGGSGNASGTTAWSIAGITLAEGVNTLTVTAVDAAGNSSSDSLQVTYT